MFAKGTVRTIDRKYEVTYYGTPKGVSLINELLIQAERENLPVTDGGTGVLADIQVINAGTNNAYNYGDPKKMPTAKGILSVSYMSNENNNSNSQPASGASNSGTCYSSNFCANNGTTEKKPYKPEGLKNSTRLSEGPSFPTAGGGPFGLTGGKTGSGESNYGLY